jgi:UDP-N-acetylmuramate dehydrogenase
MDMQQNVSLHGYSTMRLGGTADYITEAKSQEDLQAAAEWADTKNLLIRVIGSGSNIIWRDEGFKGLLVVNRIQGFEKVAEDHISVTYKIGAGENWDETVQKTAELGLYGIECLSAIPGMVGATPVQNVGAYGQDISQTMVSLDAYDSKEKKFITLHGVDCDFGYRTSRFKTGDSGRFLISSVTLKLQKNPPADLWSHSLKEYLEAHNITNRDPLTFRNAIIAIRAAKLPDPKVVANTGSFFSNPIISNAELKKIRETFPDMPAWELGPDSQKLSAGWLIETAGFKGFSDPETGMATWKNHALVIVNEHAKNTADLMKFQQKIKDKVQELFGIMLEQEPELLP